MSSFAPFLALIHVPNAGIANKRGPIKTENSGVAEGKLDVKIAI